MAVTPREITFIVSGKEQTTEGIEPAPKGASLRSAVRVGARRGTSEVVRLKARVDEDVVRLHIANGPTLYLHPDNARELLRAQLGGAPGSARGGSELGDDEFVVPSQLAWRGLESRPDAPGTRGRPAEWTGDVVVDGVDILTGVVKDKAAKLAGAAIVRKVDGQVDPGVYLLNPDSLQPLKEGGQKLASVPASKEPMLVLIHGTFSNTAGTFGKLWQTHPTMVRELFTTYGGRVYGLDHPTLGDNPFGNALLLVKTLPVGARLHLLTHSRGGLVAEALARVSGGLGTSDEDLAKFDKAAFAEYKRDLQALADEMHARKIKVERVVRVACPVRGTLLASRRLDAFLSVFKWGLQTAGIPVLPQIIDFIGEVARRRAEPEELPGLEVQMPGSAFTKWANASDQTLDSDLRVVAGDVQGDSVLSWLKTLLTDAFYWTDHDLVVQTRSMYGGTPRAGGRAMFVLDRGSKVNHFNYFSNERTATLITRGLIEETPEYFRAIGPLSWAGEDSSGIRAAIVERSRGPKPAERPAVFVLPGILGSHLKVDGKRVWLSLRFINNLDRLKWDPKSAARVVADDPVGSSYDDLIKHLADTHEVIPFGYDWRRPLEDEARRLAVEVDKALAARDSTKQPVRIVAHSMGGVLARTMELERPETWKRFIGRPGARFLMLGTPNAGSYAPMQVMSGDDTFGNLFTMFGSLFDGVEARQIVAGMPGLLQLQADLTRGARDLGDVRVWEQLASADLEEVEKRISQGSFWHKQKEQVAVLKWGLPSKENLKLAVDLRKRLDQQKFGSDAANIALVVGNAKSTPAGVDIVNDDVVYLDTSQGDGRVTLDNARLPGVRTWQVDTAHGDLADERKAFDAYLEILTTGETARLPTVGEAGAARGGGVATAADAPVLTRSRPARTMRANSPPSNMGEVFAVASDRVQPDKSGGVRFSVRVSNGNLKFVRNPLLIGHYHSLKLTGAEAVIDWLMGEAMSRSLKARLYPSDIGTHQIFTNRQLDPENPFAMPRPEAVIVIGLGEEGNLRASELIESVRQGVIAFSQRVAERTEGAPATFELASTLIGSGGINQSAGASAQAITIGVRQANIILANIGWPVVSRLTFIELYLDRAAEALNALRALDESNAKDVVVEPFIDEAPGSLTRTSEFGYRGADYDVISVYEQRAEQAVELQYTLSTRRARDEVRGSIAQSGLVDNLVASGADDMNDDPRIGRTLFKLLVPLEIEPFLAGSTSLQLLLDTRTAAYPWEMLDIQREDADQDSPPWGIQARMLRKLRTNVFRENPRSSVAGGVLVIGEPQCPVDKYPPLPGAATEAREVAKVLEAEPLLNGDALAIANAVFDRSYSILHVAGHGDVINGAGGVVLSNGITFGANEIEKMRIVPDLAFINCCHLGRFATDPGKRRSALPGGMPAFAANVAQKLIEIGVRCVIAAGWAVDDDAALTFARTFYRHIKSGRRFVDAVGEARALTYRLSPRSNTWAAYQCYGDPDWTFVPGRSVGGASRSWPKVASDRGLILRLETLAVEYQFSGRNAEDVHMELRNLLDNGNPAWFKRGEVAAAFGRAYGEIGDFENAVQWYTAAIQAEDGGAGLRALEQLGNMRARLGEKIYRRDPNDASERARALAIVEEGIELLKKAAAIAPTTERDSLLGSAYKRLAEVAGGGERSRAALEQALVYYRSAEKVALGGGGNLFYPALNSLSLELRLRSHGRKSSQRFETARIDAIRESIEQKNRTNADFWSVIGRTELMVYEALDAGRLAGVVEAAIAELRDVAKRVTSQRKWDSVVFQMRMTLEDYLKSSALPPQERAATGRLLAQMPGSEVKSVAPARARSKAAARPKAKKKARAHR